ncbi:hypothetical protein [Virgibacillus salinus]|uniref:Uncharacterized protein n=1 Tax=Virgibacillus salinus TaxID=553311 RepID=A0A1H1EHU1_9BACI|nr:hypothetical protein [Virgibacillus salinus]SDQ88365.1 hypothetical protein SAMN05216231_2898 [Virgibacillus salinus]
MLFLVENCFQWVGFHIVNCLLENGYKVDGIDDLSSDKKKHLSMFVGRNSSFQHIFSYKRDATYDSSIKITENQLDLTLQQNTSHLIKLPILFGEWMPMKINGMYHNNSFIPFDSDIFLNEAIYIGDFMKSLTQWIKSSQLPEILEVKSINNKQSEEIKLENSVYIRNNRTIEENLKMVIKHYEKFEDVY